jgi:hypothetical protein
MTTENTFDTFAIVELFGHARIAGRVSEQVIAGQGFVRVDVPANDEYPAFTRMFGTGAIYSITPVDESIARAAAERMRENPVTIYIPALPQPSEYEEFLESELDEEDLDGEEHDFDPPF